MPENHNPSLWRRRIGTALISAGFDPRKLSSLRLIPRFLRDLRRFRAAGGRVGHLVPILSDFEAAAGDAKGHYFHQDLLVAGFIHKAAPERHVDVGSRIDGFVAHVAAFRPIEVIDIRPLDAGHHAISFIQRDILGPGEDLREITDSLSCLHALEHFGLGRYGDPVDPEGHLKGFDALHRMLKPGGILYLSFPIGAGGVQFNAQRIFAPADVLCWSHGRFDLVRFDYVDDAGSLHQDADIAAVPDLTFGCGVYTLRKIR
jgi:SAM-dependent methyltransferase